MSNSELQTEEKEVILSIYDGDVAFNQLSSVKYQYKYGADGDSKSFLLELSWGENYPNEKPTVNLDLFYNNHIVPEVKEKIRDHVENEAEQWLGCAMTYTLFESVKEHLDTLVEAQPENAPAQSAGNESDDGHKDEPNEVAGSSKKDKKELLSKSQKRKAWDRVDSKGERARGWNWVDIVQHLSQTGTKSAVNASS